MLPDRVSNPGPLTYESGALPTALRSPTCSFVVEWDGVFTWRDLSTKLTVNALIWRYLNFWGYLRLRQKVPTYKFANI